MKLLYINILYAPYLYGGAERTLQVLAEGMAARGHEVTVLSTGPDPGIKVEHVGAVRVLRAGVRNVYWHAIRKEHPRWKRALWHLLDVYNPFMRRVVAEVVRREQPDVVSLHNLPGFSVSAWDAVRDQGIPMVQVLHDQYLLCPRCTMFREGRLCRRQCLSCRTMRYFHPGLSSKVDAVVGVSKFVLEHHLRHGYFSATPVKRTINNVRTNRGALDVPRRKADGTVHFGFIGTLDQNKGIELLLRSFRNVCRENWRLHVAGSGSAAYEESLRASYQGANIVFHGVQRPEDFYPDIDVLVVPSIWNDTLPGVVFEGLSYGLPVIGARRGGIPEMVQDGVNGLLFDPDRSEELELALTRLAEDERLRSSTSAAARAAAAHFLDLERFLSGYEELYGELCKNNRSS